ncbi:hypothetical protein [Jongsikchunia kroppenstedtii]|uniref:hypothetical protein n=1 Tax=Jongsikchunia kroppenstedtii TaxID=1121721 RepID=UPI0003768F4A|nr:hypothetical protein [Jongsikchunia kroppenstedtii]
MTGRGNRADLPPSIGRIALLSISAGIVTLLISVPIILGLATVSPLAALIVALLAIVLCVAVMGIVANRIVNKMVDREMARRANKTDIRKTEGE